MINENMIDETMTRENMIYENMIAETMIGNAFAEAADHSDRRRRSVCAEGNCRGPRVGGI